MPLPTTGDLSLSQVQAEFGAPASAPLSAFLRGGAYVPNIPANNNVPTALPISLRQLLGATRITELTITPSASIRSANANVQISQAFTVSGGSGTPTWSIVGVGFALTNPNSTTCTVSASGANGARRTGTLTCNQGGLSKSAQIEWSWGVPV